MHIRSLFLKNFRNYEEKTFVFGPNLNLICGPNALGKTTILEAISLLATGRSFRSSLFRELVRHDEVECVVALTFVKLGVEQTLRMVHMPKGRKFFHNVTVHSSSAALLGALPCTLMIPDDLSIIKGQPKERRRYLDLQLAQADPLYVYYLHRYQRAMIQRNALLKARSLRTIEIWEQEMAQAAGYLIQKRFVLVRKLQEFCAQFFSEISSSKEHLLLQYKSGCPEGQEDPKSWLLNIYQTNRPRELAVGMSLAGPHRDDLLIFVNGKEARDFSSEGQQKSCVAALRLAEWVHLRDQVGMEPIFLVDDLGLSLDAQRRARLFACLEGAGQVFVTSTESEMFGRDDCFLLDLQQL